MAQAGLGGEVVRLRETEQQSFSTERKSRLWSLSVWREHPENRYEGEAEGRADEVRRAGLPSEHREM